MIRRHEEEQGYAREPQQACFLPGLLQPGVVAAGRHGLGHAFWFESRLGGKRAQDIEIAYIGRVGEVCVEEQGVELFEPPMVTGVLGGVEGGPRIRHAGRRLDHEAELLSPGGYGVVHARYVDSGQVIGQRHAFRRRLRVKLEAHPFDFQWKLGCQTVGKTLADEAEGSHVVGEYAHLDGHSCASPLRVLWG